MKYSGEKDIMRYPKRRMRPTSRPPEIIGGVTFWYYDLGGGVRVWRTADNQLEVGRVGGTWYGKLQYRIIEGIFTTHRAAMRRCVELQGMFTRGEIQTPPSVNPLA